jgi:uncharacterized protein with FMN-binding domain
MVVRVTVSGGKIADIALTSHNEDAEYLEPCMWILGSAISKQSTSGIDTVAGSTYSSRGLIGAISNALAGAKV